MNSEYLSRIFALHQVLIFRDLKATYQNTWLGYAWTLVTPLLYAGILVFLFEQVLQVRIRRFSSYLLIGILCYRWFQSALSQGARSLTANRVLAKRPGFATEVLPVVAVTGNLLNFLLSIPILAIVLALGGSELTTAVFALPLLLVIQYVLTLGFSYFLAGANLMFRDTAHISDLALTAGFFLTPIFYSIDSVPEHLRFVFYFNPLVPLLEGYREVLIEGRWPDMVALAAVAIVSVALLIFGFRTYRRLVDRHIEEA